MITKQETLQVCRYAENLMIVLFQKRLRHGNVNHDPKFQYIAKKI